MNSGSLKGRAGVIGFIVAETSLFAVFVVVFAWTYLTMARSDPATFTQPLTRVSALYLTVTVFSTVGFGDITPVTDAARVTVMAQMVPRTSANCKCMLHLTMRF